VLRAIDSGLRHELRPLFYLKGGELPMLLDEILSAVTQIVFLAAIPFYGGLLPGVKKQVSFIGLDFAKAKSQRRRTL
jgi:hypothetical protein